MKKIYNKQKIKKALEIDIYPRGGGKIDLRTLADTADHVVINDDTSDGDSSGANNDADEVLPIYFYYVECTEDDPFDEAFGILSQKYGVNYYAQNRNGLVYLSPLGNGVSPQIHEGQEVKNVMFGKVYEEDGYFMDLDYPNSFMNETVGLHQIEITNQDYSTALCSVSNKRLIALLATVKYSNDEGASDVPEEEVVELGYEYEKALTYGIYVLYDLKVERITEPTHEA